MYRTLTKLTLSSDMLGVKATLIPMACRCSAHRSVIHGFQCFSLEEEATTLKYSYENVHIDQKKKNWGAGRRVQVKIWWREWRECSWRVSAHLFLDLASRNKKVELLFWDSRKKKKVQKWLESLYLLLNNLLLMFHALKMTSLLPRYFQTTEWKP